VPLLVINHYRVCGPVRSSDRASRQFVVKKRSFSDQSETVTFFDHHLHIGRM
jgi:hypothetical protein